MGGNDRGERKGGVPVGGGQGRNVVQGMNDVDLRRLIKSVGSRMNNMCI